MQTRPLQLIAAAALLVFAGYRSAAAWGPEGHALIGKIADQLLAGTPAGQRVDDILGAYTLEEAAKWPDCVRSVHKLGPNDFQFKEDKFTATCTVFESPDERKRMEDYARRNWDAFPYRPGKGDHEAYHFADIPIQEGSYSPTDIGASEHDVVHAIGAAIAELTGKPVPKPFDIKHDKEAILMLAHFVGDVHQPLHVGAVYLDPQGHVVRPHSEAEAEADSTAGGNFIEVGAKELHREWDSVPKGTAETDISVLVSRARDIPADPNVPFSDWAVGWASESVAAAAKAYAEITFANDGTHKWRASFANRTQYLRSEHDEQELRIIQAGARLAALFKAIWP
jgi:hypothetical protein